MQKMKIKSSDIFVIKSIFKSDIFHGIFSTKSAKNSKIWFENKSIAFTLLTQNSILLKPLNCVLKVYFSIK